MDWKDTKKLAAITPADEQRTEKISRNLLRKQLLENSDLERYGDPVDRNNILVCHILLVFTTILN